MADISGFKTVKDLYWKYNHEEVPEIEKEDFYKLLDAIYDFMIDVEQRFENLRDDY